MTAQTPGRSCDRLWTAQDVARFLRVPVTTLYQWRYVGTGPTAYRVGRDLRYDPDVVRGWLDEQQQMCPSQTE